MPAPVAFRSPYQEIYDSFCLRPDLAQNDDAAATHKAFNAALRIEIKKWIKSRQVPSRDTIAARCDALYTQLTQPCAPASDETMSEGISATHLDRLLSSVDFAHSSFTDATNGKTFIEWTALIGIHDIRQSEIEFFEEYFFAEADRENGIISIPSGRALVGPRFLSTGSTAPLNRADQAVRRQLRAATSETLKNIGVSTRRAFRLNPIVRAWDTYIISTLAR